MSEEINRILDELIDDFRFVLNLAIEWLKEPSMEQELIEIYNKWFGNG